MIAHVRLVSSGRSSLRLIPALLAGAMLAAPGAAQPLVIDDFEEGSFAFADRGGVLVPPVVPSDPDGQDSTGNEQIGLSQVVGGVRLVSLRAGQIAAMAAVLEPVDGADDGVVISWSARGSAWLIYDGAAGGATGSGPAGALDLDLSGFGSIVVEASPVVAAHPEFFRFYLSLSDSTRTQYAERSIAAGENVFPLSDFPNVDLSHVRQIQIELWNGAGLTDVDHEASVRILDISAEEGTILYVGSGGCGGLSPCYATIQAAVDAAGRHDTVRVQPGSYPELVRISGKTDLTLEGDPASPPGSAVIEPPDAGLISCLAGTAAVEIASSSGVTLRRLAISGYDGTGVRVRGASQANTDVQILGMRIAGNGSPGCGAGIRVEEPNAGTLIAHNVIYADLHDGIAFSGAPPLATATPQYLWSNTIHGNGRHGVVFSGFERPFLWNNLIAGNGAAPAPFNTLPAYGIARDLTGLVAPLTSSAITLRYNLVCGNRSGELSLAPTEVPITAGNQTPTGSEGTGFAASADCGDSEVLFSNAPGADALTGTLDDDFFLNASSPAVDAGDGVPTTPLIGDVATLQSDLRRGDVRPADGDDDGDFDYDIGALEYGVAPAISISSPTDGSTAPSHLLDITGSFTGTAPFQVSVNGSSASVTGQSFEGGVTLGEGANTFTAQISNAFGEASDEVTVTLPPMDVAITSPADGAVTTSSSITVSGTVNDSAAVVSVNGVAATVSNHTFSASGIALQPLTNVLTATAARTASSATATSIVVRSDTAPPPAAPSAAGAATPIDPSGSASLADTVKFLYTGANAIQSIPNASVIDARRVAVVRGKISKRNGGALVGVTVSVLSRPEFGSTHTQADGSYDLVVNGGSALTIDFRLPGYLPAQRRVDVPWRDYAIVDDLVMLPLDPAATSIELGASSPAQVARGSISSDEDGTRRATAFFPPGTTAQMKMPSGNLISMSSLTMRFTEFTVGSNGPQAMPGSLPPTSAYTYAVELSADEAVQAGATTVLFNQPVAIHLENFLSFPVGTAVPVGSYDPQLAAWVPELNGKVIRIDSIDGDGLAVVSPTMTLSAAERTALANLYTAGRELWRAEVTHFTSYDENYGTYPIVRNSPQGTAEVVTPNTQCTSRANGSVIECESQVLGESIALAQVPFSLHYRTNRTSGYLADRTVKVPITGSSVPAGLKRVDVIVDVAGKRSATYHFPATANQPEFLFTWDGKDVYDRAVTAAPGTVHVGYIYDEHYVSPGEGAKSFGELSPTGVQFSFSRVGIASLWRDHPVSLISLDARGWGLGGWTLTPHHLYERTSQTLYLGNGEKRNAGAVAPVIHRIAGGTRSVDYLGSPDPTTGVPGPAKNVHFGGRFAGLAAAADGSLYLMEINGAFPDSHRLYKVDPQGYMTAVTAAGAAPLNTTATGGFASQTPLSARTTDIAAGADGSIYLMEYTNSNSSPGRILRIDPADGKIKLFAGGTSTTSPCANEVDPMIGEGGPATSAPLCLYHNSRVEVGPDGSVYFSRPTYSSLLNGSIRRVRPDGTLDTVALSRVSASSASDGKPALDLGGGAINRFTLDREGQLYFAAWNSVEHAIFAVRPEDGVVQKIAGGGNPADGVGDGGPALQARFTNFIDLAAGPGGRIYVAEQLSGGGRAVRSFVPGGEIQRTAGTGAYDSARDIAPATGDGGASVQASLAIGGESSLVFSPDGRLYFDEVGDPAYRQVRALTPLVPFDPDEMTIASEDGRELYDFDAAGRHLRTRNARTNAKLLTFCYNGDGHLEQIRQVAPANANVANSQDCTFGSDDLVTTVEWSGANPTAVIGPFGARTELSVDGNGYLASVSDPLDNTHALANTASGLLTRFTPPEGGDHVFEYDTLGLLERDEDRLGGYKQLTRADVGDATSIAVVTAMGRTDSKTLEPDGNGGLVRTFERIVSGSTSLVTTLIERTGVSSDRTLPDGTHEVRTLGPDSRFSLSSPIVANETITTPALTQVRTHARTANVTNGNLVSEVDTLKLNSHPTMTATYTASTKITTTVTPAGRQTKETIDAQGRLTRSELVGLDPVSFTHDTRGRLTGTSQGSGADQRNSILAYDADGNLVSITDAESRETRFTYDDAGRLTKTTLPDLREIGYAYDANGNLAELTPPGQPAHVFRYSLLDQEKEYEPPAVGADDPRTYFTYNLDRDLTQIDRPDGSSIVLGYDTAGRFSTAAIARGTVTQSYHATTGHVSAIAAPVGENLAFTYDGFLPKRTTWSGTVGGYVEHGWNNDFEVSSQTVNGASSVSFGYDHDGLLTSAGSETITRHAQTGLITGTSLGGATGVATTLGYNTFGEQTSETATINGNPVYATSFTRDKLGRIEQNVETIQGTMTTWDYRYDTAGRLDQVEQNGSVVRTYTYDDNGNRLSVVAGVNSTAGTYDDQDRLLTYGASTYSYDAAGDLESKTGAGGETEYTYDELGNLTHVAFSGGSTIDYVIDGQNRRIGKKVNGTLVKGWLYQDQLEPVAELNGSGAVVSRFVYGSKANVPDYTVQGGNTYRILSDHLGSVRLVVNTSTGTIAQRIDYDEFGNITNDTNPGFQPFGFAGGLYDADTELTRFGARDYDAQIGRWTTKDPIRFDASGTNFYGYVLNDPVNLLDMNGLDVTVNLYPSAANGAGHVGIGVNTSSTQGLYPAPDASAWRTALGQDVPGIIKPDPSNPGASVTIPTTPAQDKAIQVAIDARAANPGKYNLYNNNCSSFVQGALNAGGVPTSGTIFPKRLFNQLNAPQTPN